MRAVAWLLLAVQAAMVAATAALGWDLPGTRVPELLPTLVALLLFPVVGALLVGRRPASVVGWLLVVAPLGEYAAEAGVVAARRGVPLNADAVSLIWIPSFLVLTVLIPLLFPTGRPPSPRWRWAVWAAAILTAVPVAAAVSPLLGGPRVLAEPPAVGRFERGAFVAMVALSVVGAASVVVRFRRSRGIERAQLKWFAAAVTVVTVEVVVTELLGIGNRSLYGAFAFATVPIAIGVAVLRYRLFEIDRLLSRTVAYALLTALLAAAYLAVVTVLTAVARPLLGGDQPAVAAAALAVAVLFRPLRVRVQAAVDRRFDRRRHDAARVVAAYRDRLRDEVDLDAVAAELLAAVTATVQPVSAWLWIGDDRPADAPVTVAVTPPGRLRARTAT